MVFTRSRASRASSSAPTTVKAAPTPEITKAVIPEHLSAVSNGSEESPEEKEKALLAWVSEVCQGSQALTFEQGWSVIQRFGIDTLCKILTGVSKEAKPFGTRGFSALYTISYRMSASSPDTDHSEQLYKGYVKAITEYLNGEVIPSLREKHDTYLLDEFVTHWDNHKTMVQWMTRLFQHLDSSPYVETNTVLSLTSAGLRLYYEIVYDNMRQSVAGTILSQMDRDREGESINDLSVRTCVQVLEMMGVAQTETQLKSLKAALKIKSTLEVYTRDFEVQLLQHTRDYFARKCQSWQSEMSTPEHLRAAQKALVSEERRVHRYLNITSLPKILSVVREELVRKPCRALLEREGSGCRALLQAGQAEDLGLMYRLLKDLSTALEGDLQAVPVEGGGEAGAMEFKRVQGHELVEMAKVFKDHMEQIGMAAVEARKARLDLRAEEAAAAQAAGTKVKKDKGAADSVFIDALLGIHTEMSNLVMNQFENDNLFMKNFTDAMKFVINRSIGSKPEYPVSETLSCQFDEVLMNKKMAEQEQDVMLDRLLKLFMLLDDKDLFRSMYLQALSTRLLGGRFSSLDTERQVIAKMKMACGSVLTSPLEGMMSDYSISLDLSARYKAGSQARVVEDGAAPAAAAAAAAAAEKTTASSSALVEVAALLSDKEKASVDAIDFSPHIVGKSHWPSLSWNLEMTLPPVMKYCQEKFSQWYRESFDSRELQWLPMTGDVTVRGTFNKKWYDLQMGEMQAAALLLFNDLPAEGAGFGQLRDALGLKEDGLLKRVLGSLACGKYKLLSKSSKGKSISPTDTFCVNAGFSEKLRKLKVAKPSMEQPNKQSATRVNDDRSFTLDATIVRIMKARKMMAHTQLMTEVIKQVTLFRPDPKQIKKRIETLIEREYLERDPDDPRQYKYLA